MKEKFVFSSKEVWVAIVVVVNSLLNSKGYPSIPVTPEFMGAVGIIFFALRMWFTSSKLVWDTKQN